MSNCTAETVKVNTCDLIGVALDWAVAKVRGKDVVIIHPELLEKGFRPSPYSTDWALGGPIIDREITKLFRNVGKTYTAQIRCEEDHPLVQHKVLKGWINCAGPTPLIAAMRCYVASKLGDTVEIPKDLLPSVV